MKRILPTIADVALPAILIAAEFRRARIPRRRMNDGAIHAAFVHEGDGLVRGKVSYRPVRRIAWQAGGSEMDLRIDDLHDIESLLILRRRFVPPFGVLCRELDDRTRRRR
jgi:hypothetical protein